MCRIMEELTAKVSAITRKELSSENAITMLTDSDLPFEKIALYSKLPLEEVKEIAAGLREREK